MIILDTNIISEFMTLQPEESVRHWLNTQVSLSLYVTTITIAEITYGLRAMPLGKRQRLLTDRFEQFVDLAFGPRILPFEEKAARQYGEIMGHRKEIGRPMSVCDGQIASIAQTTGFSLATRNIKDFEQCQIALINPFEPH